ncbi:MAG TPA: serine/threonine-protein kinase [Polyangia bacterium]|nr:serine/threonine-protein kinase [Polyangia bacterium]
MAAIGRYVDLQLLGQGGMGAVYRGRDPELDRPVAIKVMLHATPDFVQRFRREAQSIARLAHANIVQVYDFGVDGEGNPYFVMELIDGTPLDEIVRTRGKMPALDVVRLAKQAAAGLAAAHRAGIVHRDVKPSNLIVDGRGHLKLVDFGIARMESGAQLTNAAALMGTPGYMAPEQAAGKKVDARADIYALGMTMFEMCAGGPAFTADDPIALVVMNMQQPLPDLRQHAPGVPEELVGLIEMMAQKDPDARLQSCDAVVAALEDIEARLRTGTASFERRTDQAAAQIPATNVHGSRPPAVDSAVAAGLQNFEIPTRSAPTRGGKSSLAIGVGVGAVVLVAGIGAVMFMNKKPPVVPKIEPPLVIKKDPPKEAPKPGDTTAGSIENQAKLPSTSKLDGPLRVAVLKFKNVGADKDLVGLELGIGETAVSAMSTAGGEVTLIERSDIESDIGELDRAKDDHFDKMTVAQKGKLEGVQVAVQGGFQRAGKLVRITARFVRVENGEIVDTLTVTRPARDVFGAQDEVASKLKQKLVALAALEKTKK